MRHSLMPIPCKPWMLNGLSERLLVSHYENDYGSAVRSLNAIQDALAALDPEVAPSYHLRAMKLEELSTRGSVILHELYFGTLGGDGAAVFTGSGPGTSVPEPILAMLQEQFGGTAEWRREFVSLARALSGGSGWVVLSYSRRDGRLHNHIATEHSHAMIDAIALLVLDMYEHAYHIDFGANASAYIDAFMRNINWAIVNDRLIDASGRGSPGRGTDDLAPSVSVEELSAELVRTERLQLIDARPKHYFSRSSDMMQGATWQDPDRVDEWSQRLSHDAPVIVYCAYGFAVGCEVTAKLRERGFNARYVKGGLAAWYGAGGERALKPRSAG
jgi:superoxide dismutase, Fe-Mn family